MLTIGICPKKFQDEFVEIQKNCIKFASKLSEDIILLGEDSRDFAYKHEFRHYEVDIEDNFPMINSIFKVLQENTKKEE